MPRTDKYANPFTGGSGMRLAGLVEQAGEVLPGSRKRRGGAGGRPRWADGRDRLRQSADGPPWRPGLIEGADTKVLTVRDGRFVLAHLRTGTYTVNFSHRTRPDNGRSEAELLSDRAVRVEDVVPVGSGLPLATLDFVVETEPGSP